MQVKLFPTLHLKIEIFAGKDKKNAVSVFQQTSCFINCRKTAKRAVVQLITSGALETPAVAAHLRGMRPALTKRKATQCLEETQTFIRL